MTFDDGTGNSTRLAKTSTSGVDNGSVQLIETPGTNLHHYVLKRSASEQFYKGEQSR